MADFLVSGIVSARDNKPYLQLSSEKGMIAQLSLPQARQIAMDMLVMASRTEADAMLVGFFRKQDYPEGAAIALMAAFREYRAELDAEIVERSQD